MGVCFVKFFEHIPPAYTSGELGLARLLSQVILPLDVKSFFGSLGRSSDGRLKATVS